MTRNAKSSNLENKTTSCDNKLNNTTDSPDVDGKDGNDGNDITGHIRDNDSDIDTFELTIVKSKNKLDGNGQDNQSGNVSGHEEEEENAITKVDC